jgi:FkbM family methyltransferase
MFKDLIGIIKKVYYRLKKKIFLDLDTYKYSQIQVKLGAARFIKFNSRNSSIKIKIGTAQPIEFHFRPGSIGDRGVIQQIFINHDYDLSYWEQGRTILKLANLFSSNCISPLIIDAGANIGGSAVFFNKIIPKSKLICIEPDPGNFSILKKNLEGIDSIPLECAISSKIGQVQLFDPGISDWGFRTKEILPEEDGLFVPSTSINTILDLYADNSVPLIAKIDIEGFENDLFLSNCEWMDKFPCIIIELHDWMLPREGSSANFIKQVKSRSYDLITRGENIFLFNMKLVDEELGRHKFLV